MKVKIVRAGLAALLLVLLSGMLAFALTGSIHPRSVVSSGGGQLQGAGMHGKVAIGQPVVGTVGNSTGDVVLCSGFMCGGQVQPSSNTEYRVYLPVIVRDGG